MMITGESRPSINDCRLIDVPAHRDARGVLRALQSGDGSVPFSFDRVFFLSDVPLAAIRANHAPKTSHQLILPLMGSVEVQMEDGRQRTSILLNDPSRALYLPPCIWRILKNFSANALCAVLASGLYDDEAYYEDYEAF